MFLAGLWSHSPTAASLVFVSPSGSARGGGGGVGDGEGVKAGAQSVPFWAPYGRRAPANGPPPGGGKGGLMAPVLSVAKPQEQTSAVWLSLENKACQASAGRRRKWVLRLERFILFV